MPLDWMMVLEYVLVLVSVSKVGIVRPRSLLSRMSSALAESRPVAGHGAVGQQASWVPHRN